MDRFAGLYIGTDRVKRHGVSFESVCVEGIELVGDLIIAEIHAIEIAGPDQRFNAAVAGVVAELQVIADGTSDLTGLVIAAEYRTC